MNHGTRSTVRVFHLIVHRMKRPLGFIVASFVLVAFGIWLYSSQRARDSDVFAHRNDGLESSDARQGVENVRVREVRAGSPVFTRNEPRLDERRIQFSRLKREWLKLGPGDDHLEERDALQAETIGLLMCSSELYELSQFLEEQGIRIGTAGGCLHEVSARIFETTKAGQARQVLLSTLQSEVPKVVLDEWLEGAGRWCPPEEFEEFRNQSAEVSAEAASSVVFGYCRELFRSKPEEAVAMFVESTSSTARSESQSSLDWTRMAFLLEPNLLPQDTDFEGLIQLFEQVDPEGERFPNAIPKVFEAWASRSPADAANMILSKPESFDPGLLVRVGKVAAPNPGVAIDWINRFPKGPHRDAVALGSVENFRMPDPESARKIAAMIDDPDTRRTAIEKIVKAENTVRNGSSY